MAIDAEMIADRSRLRRKLSFWRVAAILVLVLAVIAGGLVTAGRTGLGNARPQIARISVGGFIAGDQRMTDLFKRVGETASVKGVVISISSPGGTTTGSEELFHGIRELAAKKPLVAFVDGTAASGAYITAIAADRIVARETAIVGSIGVLFQ
jgi:protease-4